ncbi:MAG: hypothetical protein ABEI74_03765 [Candidatus Pacearchaeota archaeon]
MEKRQYLAILITLLVVLSLGIASAQKNSTKEPKIDTSAGLTPDSPFYFVDKLLDNFKSDFKIKEERVAEIKKLIKEGKIKEAKEALERYKKIANKLEEKVPPSKKEEAKESAKEIKKTVRELEKEIPKKQREIFVDKVVEQEKEISKTAKIAKKVKDLCKKLAKKDPKRYAKVCNTDKKSPEWKKELDKKLAKKQKKEAKKFEDIMSQCFETSGQKCRCDEIPFEEFSKTCSKAAPLAKKCKVGGNKEACKKLSQLEMPELPPHLEKSFEKAQQEMRESKFNAHIPKPCREAGVTSPKECEILMMKKEAPEECRKALEKKDVKSPKKAEKICEKVMFKKNLPEECQKQNTTNPEKCRKKFSGEREGLENRPENSSSPILKEEIIIENTSERIPLKKASECKDIKNLEKKEKCIENFVENMEETEKIPDKDFPAPCKEKGIESMEKCEKIMENLSRKNFQQKEPEPPLEPKTKKEIPKNNQEGSKKLPRPCQEEGIKETKKCYRFMQEKAKEQDRENFYNRTDKE